MNQVDLCKRIECVPLEVTGINAGTPLHIKELGEVSGVSSPYFLRLKNVLLCPEASKNLLLLGRFCEQGCNIWLNKKGITIYNSGAMRILLYGRYEKPFWTISLQVIKPELTYTLGSGREYLKNYGSENKNPESDTPHNAPTDENSTVGFDKSLVNTEISPYFVKGLMKWSIKSKLVW